MDYSFYFLHFPFFKGFFFAVLTSRAFILAFFLPMRTLYLLQKVQSYSRTDAPGTLRRKDETRKNARAELKERKAAERHTKEQELRRLKNLKAQALKKKLEEISALSGGAELDVVDLDGKESSTHNKCLESIWNVKFI